VAQAIALANDSDYGLGANIYTNNLRYVMQAMEEVKAGTFWVNDPLTDNEAGPFGGMRQSGIGRELGEEGLEAFREPKHVHIDYVQERKSYWFPYANRLVRTMNTLPLYIGGKFVNGADPSQPVVNPATGAQVRHRASPGRAQAAVARPTRLSIPGGRATATLRGPRAAGGRPPPARIGRGAGAARDRTCGSRSSRPSSTAHAATCFSTTAVSPPDHSDVNPVPDGRRADAQGAGRRVRPESRGTIRPDGGRKIARRRLRGLHGVLAGRGHAVSASSWRASSIT
jgi:hypothetical protein